MQIGTELLIYGLIFLSVLALVEGLYLTLFGKSISLNARVNRRLEMLEKGLDRDQVLEQLRKEMTQHMRARGIPLYALLAERAQKANIAFTPLQLIAVMVVLSVLAFLGLTVGTEAALPVRALASVAIGVGGVCTWVNGKASKRLGLIEEQLPDAVELMVRALRVGHPFVAAINIVASEVPDPLGSEFGVIADEVAYGRDIGEALKDLAERVGMQDLRFLAVAVTIQQQSGGNLAEVLAGLAKVIRSRCRCRSSCGAGAIRSTSSGARSARPRPPAPATRRQRCARFREPTGSTVSRPFSNPGTKRRSRPRGSG
ncbi:pilus assembly protein TadB [Rhodovulum sulfidophilum]|uniref:type II secretion system F family protein n=1 Tax=Rhodovulum sulfidophilum TaxID=35806 RepID=UPI0019146AC6|nr:type II secretion system F family protein [Rhodovulum sulfidophilum]MBK5923320.1 pilus assembly protein TadB [Rhodovulum sulfidophilum]